MKASVLVGIVAALLAALVWSLNFIVPFVIGDYSIFDFGLFRYLICGLLAFVYLMFKWESACNLRVKDWLICFALGLIGSSVYFQALAAAAVYAGPMIAPAFLALVPVLLAIAGNLQQPTIAWRHLAFPFTLATIGLLLVNWGSFDQTTISEAPSLLLGIPLAILAAACWVWFGLFNQSALAKRPQMNAGVWTALIMIGAGLGMLAFIPFGLVLNVFASSRLGLGWNVAASLYIWGTVLALATLGGGLAWTFASQRLPVAISAQLITMEPVFGTTLGLLIRRRWPTLMEGVGMIVLLVGVVTTIRIFHDRRSIAAIPDLV